MSLNGLDDARVTEAYQGALAEGGGWFLLKYASRDAVEVLARGTGGAVDARAAVAQYEDKSPLYGFLLYRRRKVLIKYMPEGTSRLLQARVAVHFTAVCEKLTPHDTTISIASADELSDAALAAACSLHTAAPSSCSSSGSSRRKLDEITEDAEEGQATEDDTASLARPGTATSVKPIATGPTAAEAQAATQALEEPASSEPPKAAPTLGWTQAAEEPQSPPSHIAVDAAPEDKPESKASDYRESLKVYDDLFKNGPDPRLSSQTARPAMSDLYAEIYAQYKPKVKLGPRPKQSLDVKRPHTSGTGAQNTSRPVSSLPAGMRVANRKTMEPKRPKSRESSAVPSIAFPPPPPVPSVPEIPLISLMHPPKSPASVKSMPIPSYTGRNPKSPGITPEKQRLMKALELRKKHMKAKQAKEETKAENASDETSAGAEDDAKNGSGLVMENSSMGTVKEEASAVTDKEQGATAAYKEDGPPPKVDKPTPGEMKSPNPTEDSGVEMLSNPTETDDHASASSPISAQTQGSLCAPSTRPSSISEDDNLLSERIKTEEAEQATTEAADRSGEAQNEDEKESIGSTPTVVPESSTPVPSVEVASHPESQQPDSVPQAFVSDDVLVRRNKRESMVLMPPSEQDDARSWRKSKRESMIFFPSSESSQQDEAYSKREKRESAIFPVLKRQSPPEPKEKHRAMVDPIHIHLSPENSEAEYLSDDSFMEELQSAKVEEAKPVSVSKSPITPFFPRKSSISGASIPERSTSHQYNKPGRLSPEQLMGRKASGPWLPNANTDTVVVAKKINVSSGISQRIKALAEKSNRDSSASVSPITTPDASSSIVAQRKSSFFSTPPTGNSPNGKSNRFSRASITNLNATTPDRQPVLQPPPSRDGAMVYNVKQGIEKPESVQVTARIVRDVRTQKPSLKMPTGNTPLELHQSPIIIDHQKSTQPISTKSPVKSNAPRVESTSPRPPSSPPSRDPGASSLPRSSSESSWRSFGRRLSESKSGGGPSRSQSAHSFESCEEKREEKKEKKDSRTSKLFKRMSSISSISRKSPGANAVLEEEGLQTTSLPSLREPPPAVQVGDLNVQFPDTLLWKRRWVEIDGTGNLVLSLSKSNEQSKGITKRFHLSEFRAPYPPDQDQQELPNSVILDFIDGRTLQCACETYVAQVQVLQILREAHDAWIAYNQGQ